MQVRGVINMIPTPSDDPLGTGQVLQLESINSETIWLKWMQGTRMRATEYRMKLVAKSPDKEGAERARLVQVAAVEVNALRDVIKIPHVSVAVVVRWQSIVDSEGYDRSPSAAYLTAYQALKTNLSQTVFNMKMDRPLGVEGQGEPAVVTLPSLSVPSVLSPNYVEQHQAQLLQAVQAVLTLILGEGATVSLRLGEQEAAASAMEINIATLAESVVGSISTTETLLGAAKHMIADYSSALATANPTITIKDEDGVEVKGEVGEGEEEVKHEEGAGGAQGAAVDASASLPARVGSGGEDVPFLTFEEILVNHLQNLLELRDYTYVALI
uniref:Uncharacterized protein n=1 Tax=Chromera velia CCMP2878 TaxID=1169474 RepID=A0A0G4FA02_9ALVE|eukprot:Cvel_15955.t1-p1 / transcript=Cvel_15955.t1 / gene=Cvel_15955 / organism=Chromera_velia_CCMP2878 / gene_product=hypothetical protein / transcript_product=hypothetical protein / location=Cvel_scaffold1207:16156-17912(+) / protein_length=326 / sequence_SO=supercontig / SO=protein_coding / is_pseudo=false